MNVGQLEIRGVGDARAAEQMVRCLAAEEGAIGALSADHHVGYSMPIGGAAAYRNHISPSGVGYDIGCGNKAVKTNILYSDIIANVPYLMDEIARRISFGMGRNNDEPVDHLVLEAILQADFTPQRKMIQSATNQLGTVGSGNHYVDLFVGSDDHVWIGVHFGSRGFGHKTASGFLALAEGKEFTDHATDGEMDSPPVLFDIATDLGQSYIAAMQLAGDYAYAGRDIVCDKVLEILGGTEIDSVHNHHNYAWLETHFGEDFWVVRKGCTPAWPGQRGFVGATMAEDSVILEGIPNDAPGLLASTVHGAGRVMSRTQAAGKVRRRKRWGCPQRDCTYVSDVAPGKTNRGGPTNCPIHGLPVKKFWITERKTEGRIDWQATLDDLKLKGIELRGAAADEAPGAYKRLSEVLGYHDDTIRVLETLRPIGVAMAGSDTYDPYKD
jgi:tRNA-splicing ligase RtcB